MNSLPAIPQAAKVENPWDPTQERSPVASPRESPKDLSYTAGKTISEEARTCIPATQEKKSQTIEAYTFRKCTCTIADRDTTARSTPTLRQKDMKGVGHLR